MRTSEQFAGSLLVGALVLFGAVGPAAALDEKAVVKQSERSPWDVFRFGFSAYKKGKKEEAVEAYRYAAENGQVGARWKLARMYAEGDGVTRNHYEAFKFFSAVIQHEVHPGSRDETYISDALVAIGRYLKNGIPDTPVVANPAAAQEYFMRAAAAYRNREAQYELGQMLLSGEGGTRNVQQAARWLQLAAEKGHAGAQATLGNLLFQSGNSEQIVLGLALLTSALENAAPADVPWIRDMQEQAFALAGEADRRTAIALADDIRENGLK
ncbi:tetratricopeptide repeat protein [Chelativorans sp. M5D2P16]|uniref:tetratricopeptide repeat protein n=1 Tax=Chelativorans sp. M5D2P16 TaxID=3095678 RepID=UPI002ACAD325|nr:tetratricopeptide repeat protein [Chelativorans sp. M5D2P16]MDZ5697005.1 tetratricopeptide repeat protein [Chelativorans sp. M5D2P16]